jgi:hypothetical protein
VTVKAAVIVDWPDLRNAIRLAGKQVVVRDVAAWITSCMQEDALSANQAIDRYFLFSDPTSLGDEFEQQAWHDSDIEIINQPGTPSNVRERVIAASVAAALENSYQHVYIISGQNDYSVLTKELRKRGISLTHYSERSRPIVQLIESAADVPSTERERSEIVTNTGEEELSGVIRLIRSAVIMRTQRQLSITARALSTPAAAASAVEKLLGWINRSEFAPQAILAWTDETRHWNGSLEVAARLSSSLTVPVFEASIREEGEGRHIIGLPEELSTVSKVLVVDDAAFTGRTLRLIKDYCASVRDDLDTRGAVLSSLSPAPPGVDFWGETHEGTDVLFPWGWARSVDQFYDLLRKLGTRDRRWMPRQMTKSMLKTCLTEQEASSTFLLENLGGNTAELSKNEADGPLGADSDHVLYVVSGNIEIFIGEAGGCFKEGEFLFVPSVVSYRIMLEPGSKLLRLEFRHAIGAL